VKSVRQDGELKEIAQLSEARFDWWIQKNFQVLPTDDRFTNLTLEQKDLMYEHFLLDNPELTKKDTKARDDSFDEEYDNPDDRPPMQDHEHYDDPNFDEAWNSDDEDAEEDDGWEDLTEGNTPLPDGEDLEEV
jgi:hypothetical protein